VLCHRCHKNKVHKRRLICQECINAEACRKRQDKEEPESWHEAKEAPNALLFTEDGPGEVSYTPEQDAWIKEVIRYKAKHGIQFMHAVHWLDLAKEFFGIK
jgi:hypothetical protein